VAEGDGSGGQEARGVRRRVGLFTNPLFLDQIETLLAKVEAIKTKDPKTWKQKNSTKRLAAITKLALEDIPENPTRPEYRQGGSLGAERKHWFRAKFFQQYRLFFRYHAAHRIIVYAWANESALQNTYNAGWA
jgi:toxin YhaV